MRRVLALTAILALAGCVPEEPDHSVSCSCDVTCDGVRSTWEGEVCLPPEARVTPDDLYNLAIQCNDAVACSADWHACACYRCEQTDPN